MCPACFFHTRLCLLYPSTHPQETSHSAPTSLLTAPLTARVLGAGSSRKQRAPNQETPSRTVMSQGLKAPSSLLLWLSNSGVPALLSFLRAPIGLYPTFPWQRSMSQNSQLARFTSCSLLLHRHFWVASQTSFCSQSLVCRSHSCDDASSGGLMGDRRRGFCLNP